MTLPVLILLAVTASHPIPAASPQDGLTPPAQEQIDASTRKIKELQKERIDALEAVVAIQDKLFKDGVAQYREVLEARQFLLQAQLDLADKAADRIALYKKAIDSIKQLEEIASAHVLSGTGTEASVLQAKAQRLAVEIQLEREMIKQAKEGK
jgi:outer membrane protein TolC